MPRIEDVGGMQKCGALQADIDECRLHARQHPGNPAFVDVADQSTAAGALQKHLLQHAVFDDGRARLVGGGIDQNLGAHRPRSPRCHTATPAAFSSAAVSNSGNPMTPE
jgi:hypothetical protein